ncbi:hypothetical protein [Micromonospora sp. NPDC050276]|uniref:hypothetical protein n=1 Tax=Micromonospora sp. NPDC050276 TaxID=3364278 RepID=UPI0037B90D9C
MAGDSVGGNAAIALILAAKQHGDVPLAGQVCSPRSPTQVSTHARTGSSRRAASCAVTSCSGTATSTPPTPRSVARSPPRRCAPSPSNWPGCTLGGIRAAEAIRKAANFLSALVPTR